ncbi:pullulanase X25 domain-containing protein [Tessaracoccus coleopterorum]|uniref:pullulanase X25 domain-containing protein n=1 Tax=Tessaracoccus coleopterorum TaxID=2714950 RepID=UPI0018D2C5D0|nr:hypothetical protein [Tessaracoccus coleopterorum]
MTKESRNAHVPLHLGFGHDGPDSLQRGRHGRRPHPSASAATTAVTLVGDLQDELGCAGDWQPDCDATALGDPDGDGTWTADFTVPAGDHEFKIAINRSWDEAYGPAEGTGR